MGGIDEEMEKQGEEEEETCGFGQIGSSEDENRVVEWEIGLPSADDLMPLSQLLIPPELASAFSISPEPFQTTLDVSRASHKTLASLRNNRNGLNSIPPFDAAAATADAGNSAAELKRAQRFESEEGDSASASASASAAGADCDDQSARVLKRPRLVWTPQFHKRFVDVVTHLGIKNAVPKTIMKLMNVEGLTRENVASHLQKYRLYLKRMQGLSTDDPSSSDQLFASTPVPQSLQDAGKPGGSSSNGGLMPILMPYSASHMMPMPVLSMPNGHGHMPAYHGFESHPYGMFREQQQREWSGKNFGAMMAYPHMAPSDK